MNLNWNSIVEGALGGLLVLLLMAVAGVMFGAVGTEELVQPLIACVLFVVFLLCARGMSRIVATNTNRGLVFLMKMVLLLAPVLALLMLGIWLHNLQIWPWENIGLGVALQNMYPDAKVLLDENEQPVARWQATEEDVGSWYTAEPFLAAGEGVSVTVETRILLALPFRQGKVKRFIILTGTALPDYTCTQCPALIGGGLFSRRGKEWLLDSVETAVTQVGSWGRVPKGKLVEIGPDKRGVLFQDELKAQAYVGEHTVILTDVGGVLREVLRVETHASNENGCGIEGFEECWEYTSTWEFTPGRNLEYDDFHMTISGTRYDGVFVQDAYEERLYVFDGAEYILSD